MEAILTVAKIPEIELLGFHCHVGSQILESEPFGMAADRLIALLARYRDHFGTQLPELDLGGGYGISYLEEDEELLLLML